MKNKKSVQEEKNKNNIKSLRESEQKLCIEICLFYARSKDNARTLQLTKQYKTVQPALTQIFEHSDRYNHKNLTFQQYGLPPHYIFAVP